MERMAVVVGYSMVRRSSTLAGHWTNRTTGDDVFFLYRRGDPWQQTGGQSSDDQSENRPRTPKVLHGRLGQGSLMVVSALVADVARRHFAYFYSTFFLFQVGVAALIE